MKKLLISTVVGAFILFLWQWASWMAPIGHKHSFKYNSNQDSIMASLNKNISEDGTYMLPFYDVDGPNAKAEREKCEQNNKAGGKPMAILIYNKAPKMDLVMPMITGFIINLIAVYIVAMMLINAGSVFNSFGKRMMFSLMFGVVMMLQTSLLNWNWMGFHFHYVIGDIIDQLVGWGLCGAWFGWFLGRE